MPVPFVSAAANPGLARWRDTKGEDMFFNDDPYPGDNWDPGTMMNGYRGDNMMDGGGWFMMIFGLILLVLTVAAVVWAFRASGSHPTDTSRGVGPVSGSARDVLDQRLARGEISPEDYSASRTLLDQ